VDSVSSGALKAVLRTFFGDATFRTRFGQCPAGQSLHHAYLGGLLEHTVSVTLLCRHVAAANDAVDGDLLVTAALLHDVGKVREFVWDTVIRYSDEGRLVGHVVLGEQMVREAAASSGLPGEIGLALSHALLSHHGELEWGSPKRPCTLEGLALHHADNMDAKLAAFSVAITATISGEQQWSGADNVFRRPLWAPRAVDSGWSGHLAEDDQYYLPPTGTL